jgi:hypothetical protein
MKKLLSILIVSIFYFHANATTDTVFVSIMVGGASKTAYINVVDKVTDSVILLSSVSGVTIENSHPELASVLVSESSQRRIVVSPIAGGKGYATVLCHVTYTDAGDGLIKSEDKTIIVAYTVIYNPPHGVKLSMSFN